MIMEKKLTIEDFDILDKGLEVLNQKGQSREASNRILQLTLKLRNLAQKESLSKTGNEIS